VRWLVVFASDTQGSSAWRDSPPPPLAPEQTMTSDDRHPQEPVAGTSMRTPGRQIPDGGKRLVPSRARCSSSAAAWPRAASRAGRNWARATRHRRTRSASLARNVRMPQATGNSSAEA
jgi:hypothetical protein